MISKNQIKFIRSLELKKNRKQNGLFVAEGPKVVGDLLHADYKARMLFATKPYPGAELITDDELQRISFLQHPQEILAVFEMPTLNSQPSTLNSQLSLALDGIQDQLSTLNYLSLSTAFRIQAISARLSALPTGLAFPPSTVHPKRLTSIILKWFRQQWAVWPMCK